jgi:hypothetical protein
VLLLLLPNVGFHQFDESGADCCVSHHADGFKFAVDAFRHGPDKHFCTVSSADFIGVLVILSFPRYF